MTIAVQVNAPLVFATVQTADLVFQIAVQLPVSVAIDAGGGGRPVGGNTTAAPSADPGNILTLGSDGRLFAPSALGADGGLDLTVIFDNHLL